MKLELVDVTESERRVLLLFDPNDPGPEDGAARAYIEEQGIEPRRRYSEVRDATEYEVYYFGLCYLEGHLDHLTGLATEVTP